MAGDQNNGKDNIVELRRKYYRLVFYTLFTSEINSLTLTFSNMQRR